MSLAFEKPNLNLTVLHALMQQQGEGVEMALLARLLDMIAPTNAQAASAPPAKSPQRATIHASTRNPVTNPWHAVSIEGAHPACKTASRLKGQRFLAREAPTLPLADCSPQHCRCRFRHQEDRRRSFESLTTGSLTLPIPRRRAEDQLVQPALRYAELFNSSDAR